MDRGFNVLVFPEGARSAEGKLAPFRPGIGLLAKQCGAMVLPVAIRGLGELKTRERALVPVGDDRGARGRADAVCAGGERSGDYGPAAGRGGAADARGLIEEGRANRWTGWGFWHDYVAWDVARSD